MSAQGSFPILNPNVYLNYLTHTVASDYEISRDIDLAFLGALVWDIFSSIPDDYRLIRTGRVSFVLFAYFLARLAALVMTLLSVLFKSGPVSECEPIALVQATFQIISTAAASYLFLKRVHAVYHGSKLVQHVFSFLWLFSVGTSCIVFPDSLHDYAEIADTKHCIRTRGWSALAVAYKDPLFFDSLVYIAISYKILYTHRVSHARKKFWMPFSNAKAIPHFSRAILQGGQQYYMISNVINMTRFNFVLQSTASPTYQVMLSTPAVALTSIMACRVYRNLIIEALDDRSNDVLTAPRFAPAPAVNLSSPQNAGSESTEVVYDEVDLSKEAV